MYVLNIYWHATSKKCKFLIHTCTVGGQSTANLVFSSTTYLQVVSYVIIIFDSELCALSYIAHTDVLSSELGVIRETVPQGSQSMAH